MAAYQPNVLLAPFLDVAVEYGHIPANPARGKRPKLKASKPQRTASSVKPTESRSTASALAARSSAVVNSRAEPRSVHVSGGRSRRLRSASAASSGVWETAEGLYVKGKLDLDGSEMAREAWRLVKAGTAALSFGYR